MARRVNERAWRLAFGPLAFGPLALALLLLAVAIELWAPDARSDAPPAAPRVRRVLLVSVDGLRPDMVLRARAPVLRSLMERGSYTLWAMTTAVAVTLPSHVSMLTGVTPSRHGIEWNHDPPPGAPVYPAQPTLFELARRAGYTTGMVAGKSKFAVLARPGSLDRSFVPTTTVSDSAVADTAARWIKNVHGAPQVLFVHLPGVDTAGHALGWGSDAQLAAVATADRSIGRLLAALRAAHVLDSTIVLVTSDHGGAGRTHGPDDPRSRTIPWIIAGPGIRRGLDLTTNGALNVRTEDTFATLCAVLGIVPPGMLDGRAVTEAFEPAARFAGN